MNPDFKKYLKMWLKILRFAVFFILIFSLPFMFYVQELRAVGEFIFGEEIATLSHLEPITWMSGYYNSGVIKPEVIKHFKTDVVFFGNSRVLQFRPQMFSKLSPHAFYTMGGSFYGMIHARMNLDDMMRAGNKPKVIFLGLESKWFQRSGKERSRLEFILSMIGLDGWIKKVSIFYRAHRAGMFYLDQLQLLQNAWKDSRFYDERKKKMATDIETSRRLIGMQARTKHLGFRNDGSLRRPSSAHRHETSEEVKSEAFRRIEDGSEKGNIIDSEALDLLRSFLQKCRHEEIAVIVFLLPLQKIVLDVFKTHPDAKGFWEEYPKIIQRISEEERVPFFDMTDPESFLGNSTKEFADWNHGSELTSARILLKMCEDGRIKKIVRDYLDIQQLKNDIQKARNPYSLYGD